MPLYEYRCNCGETIERTCSMNNMKKKVKCPVCGKMASRSFNNFPAVQCRYSYFERSQGNPRATRGRGY